MKRIYADLCAQYWKGVRLYLAESIERFNSGIDNADYGRNGVAVIVEGNYMLEVTNHFLKLTEMERDRWTNFCYVEINDTPLCKMSKFPYTESGLEFILHPSLAALIGDESDVSLKLSNPLFIWKKPLGGEDARTKTNIALFETDTVIDGYGCDKVFERLEIMDLIPQG